MNNSNDSDKESEYEECFDMNIKITKSLSSIGFRYSPKTRSARAMALRPTQSLFEKLHELKLDNHNVDCIRNKYPALATCPCRCVLPPAAPTSFRTREKDTLALHVFSSDILNYYGRKFKANQIAPLWKKDCRKFLWKNKL